jgi:hypothetical protein
MWSHASDREFSKLLLSFYLCLLLNHYDYLLIINVIGSLQKYVCLTLTMSGNTNKIILI